MERKRPGEELQNPSPFKRQFIDLTLEDDDIAFEVPARAGEEMEQVPTAYVDLSDDIVFEPTASSSSTHPPDDDEIIESWDNLEFDNEIENENTIRPEVVHDLYTKASNHLGSFAYPLPMTSTSIGNLFSVLRSELNLPSNAYFIDVGAGYGNVIAQASGELVPRGLARGVEIDPGIAESYRDKIRNHSMIFHNTEMITADSRNVDFLEGAEKDSAVIYAFNLGNMREFLLEKLEYDPRVRYLVISSTNRALPPGIRAVKKVPMKAAGGAQFSMYILEKDSMNVDPEGITFNQDLGIQEAAQYEREREEALRINTLTKFDAQPSEAGPILKEVPIFGKTLIADREYRKGELVMEYKHKMYSSSTQQAPLGFDPRSKDADYIWQLSSEGGFYVGDYDSNVLKPRELGALVNSTYNDRSKRYENVSVTARVRLENGKWQKLGDPEAPNPRLFYRASRDIQKGEHIITNYGASYWGNWKKRNPNAKPMSVSEWTELHGHHLL